MKHIRTQIREAVANLLTGRAPLVKVYTSRMANIAQENLPAATVILADEDSENATMGANATQDRAGQLQVQVRVRSRDESDPDQQFDAIADQCALVIEQALAESELLGGLLKFITYTGMNSEYSENQPEGVITLTWGVRYFTRALTPDQAA